MKNTRSSLLQKILTEQQPYRTGIVHRLASGFERFQKHWFCQEHNLYADLREGQQPLALVIACSDSRVDPLLLTDSKPGELFVIRNVANLVPPYSPDARYHGVSAALEYAVRHLHIPHIMVMGHANCGGISALISDDSTEDDEFLGVWMEVVHHARAMVNRELPYGTHAERCRLCEQWSIRISLQNLLTFPWIRAAVDAQELTLHGWYFDLRQGNLLYFDKVSNAFLPLVGHCGINTDLS